MHGRFISVVSPSLHKVTNVADIRPLDRRDVVPCARPLVQDFKPANCARVVS
jgi:hypothetical protein